MDLRDKVKEFIIKGAARNVGSYEVLLSRHLLTSIGQEPLKKIRLICEAKLMVGGDGEEMNKIYKVAISLMSVSKGNVINWAFVKSEKSYEEYIKPWLNGYIPDFNFVNKLDRDVKIKKLVDETTKAPKPAWEQFFIITSTIGVTDVALGEMRGMFVVHAMPIVMREFAELASMIDPNVMFKEASVVEEHIHDEEND
ncbi:MAG: hypothetical protein QXU75_09085 [Candidatus Methanomethylicaceae archaeon]